MVSWEVSMNFHTASISRAKVRASSTMEASVSRRWVSTSNTTKTAMAASDTAESARK